MQIKRVGGKSLAKVFGFMYLILGFVFGLFVFVVSLVEPASETYTAFESFAFGIGAPVVLAVFYGVLGYVMGFVTAWVYNVVAQKVGGIEIEME